ncbi:MAG: carbon storage regulator [Acidobacteria bacterium]|nr:carbon storage regulator [Acidobacteriota bacterium]
MLVIRRRVGESVLIGEQVQVTVIEVTGSRMHLGFQAPAKVRILRKGIEAAARANVAAAGQVTAADLAVLLRSLRRGGGSSGEAGSSATSPRQQHERLAGRERAAAAEPPRLECERSAQDPVEPPGHGLDATVRLAAGERLPDAELEQRHRQQQRIGVADA